MTVETITNGIEDLDPNFPAGTDPVSEGDNHVRNLKTALGLSFPNTSGAWNTTSEIRASGFDAKTVKIRNVGTPVDATDAARKGETDALDARVGALEAQGVQYRSFGTWDSGADQQFPNIAGGTGDFTVERTDTGTYNITFTETASGQWDQSLSVQTLGLGSFSLARDIDVFPFDANTFIVTVYNSNNGQTIDANLTFIRLAN